MRGEIHIADIILRLGHHNLLPAIVFRTSRVQCDHDAQNATAHRDLQLPRQDQERLKATADEIISSYEMDRELLTTHPQFDGLLKTGVAAHHAGQLLMWRLLVEEMMAAGVLRALVATGTVAAGVDFPARTVVITAHSKRGAEGFSSLTAAEFQQMSGRAGRRGRDTVGFCVAAPAPFCDARTLLRISKRPPEPLVSSYFPGPSSVLNLLRYRNVDDLRFTVQRSLAAFIDRRDARVQSEEADGLLVNLRPDLRQAVVKGLAARPTDTLETGAFEEELSDQEESQSGIIYHSKEERKLVKRIRRCAKKARELTDRQLVLLDSALNGLRQLGYVEGPQLSPKGYWAANLCTNIVLELGEIIESELLNDASAERLVAIVSSISGDEHRKYLEPKHSPLPKEDIKKIEAIVERVGKTGMPGLSSSRAVSPSAAFTALTWMQAEDWHSFRSILLLSGVAEGDAARLITQTAEHLNQITRLASSHSKLAFKAEEAKRRILRPPLTEVINLETI